MKRPGKMAQLALRTIFKKPATSMYPFIKTEMPARFRGKIQFFAEKCIGCNMCVRDCPSYAIRIEKVADKKFDCYFDLGKCIYCGQCVDVCPKKALDYTKDFELAQLDREKLKIVYRAQPDKPASDKPQGV